jgi:hypothetical protein
VEEQTCDWCGVEFQATTPWQRFHSGKCRNTFNNRRLRQERIQAELDAAEDRRDARNGHVNGGGVSFTLADLTKPGGPTPLRDALRTRLARRAAA